MITQRVLSDILRLTVLFLCATPASFVLTACGSSASNEASSSQREPHNDEVGEHDEHGSEEAVKLSAEQLERAGVRLEPLEGGPITTHITLPAEIGLNQDTLLHVIPRVPGIVSEVHGYLGQSVEAGDLLALFESPELGEAKIAYLQAVQAKAIADSELDLQQTISANTAALLEILRGQPEPDALRAGASDLMIGENKGRLLSAYARVMAAEANYARERELRDKGLSTQADLLAAQEAFNSNQAEYFAAFEDIDFTYRLRFQEAQRAAQTARSAVDNAERRLHLLGLSDEQIARISEEPNAHVARYELTAPIAGRIIAKHITPGEKVGSDESVYTIADLGTVWLNIAVYEKYINQISEGQGVVVHAQERAAAGKVTYIASTLSEGSRTATARVVMENNQGRWKPGEFLTVRIETGEVRVARRVPIEAVQQWESRSVVFVREGDSFIPTPVELGRRNDRFVEIVGDSPPLGTPIAVKNSFLMKAELGKNAAGHDH